MSVRSLNIRNVYNMMDEPAELVSKEQVLQVSGLNLTNKYTDTISKVCVIEGATSDLTVQNVKNLNYSLVLFESFNYKERKKLCKEDSEGLIIKEIVTPKSYENAVWLKHIRLRNHNLTYEQVCRILNHMIVWSYCMSEQEPVIVLEGDSMLTDAHRKHTPKNSIHCLSSSDFFIHNMNYVCMNEPYAYSIDPFCARSLFNLVMDDGIIEPLDYMIRIDKFTISNSKKAIRIRNNY